MDNDDDYEWISIILKCVWDLCSASQGETMLLAHLRILKYDTVCIFASYLMNFLCFVCSGHQTSTRGNVPYISLPWASWTYIPSIHPCRSSCISQLSRLLHLCVCCQVCQFSFFSRYIRNSLSLFWLICEVIYMLNVFLILNRPWISFCIPRFFTLHILWTQIFQHLLCQCK